ncbi:Vacuolar protein-sorting-associated protein 27 [Dinochytrium kinnereticum]|nr:Vacuolar protein-sorting-associated protein 27 [Dinochytrium kinnereticum]
MSFLFTNPFDDVVEKATSENNLLGQEDIVKNLEIADKIRGKEVPPKQAISALKKRINHKNPNVQLQALKLTDACVKNSGQHFVVEVASRDFVDNLVSVVRNYPTTNQDVRLKILALIQTWGIAFKGKSELSYVTEVYESMKREGMAFPPVEKAEASAIMIDTKIVSMPLVYLKLANLPTLLYRPPTGPILNNRLPSTPGTPGITRANTTGAVSSRKTPSSNEDDELQKAIAASLAEAKKSSKRTSSKTKPVPVSNDEDEDPELKAAIEASLAELKISEQKRKDAVSSGGAGQQPGGDARGEGAETNPNELSRVEIDNLKMFVELVERMEADVSVRGIGVIHNSQISTLYSQLMILQPKLLWSLDDAVTKYRSALEFNEKITAATQLYDRLLQDRLAAASGGYASTLTRGYSVNGGYGSFPQQAQQQSYPAGQPSAAPGQWGAHTAASYSQESYAQGGYASHPGQYSAAQAPGLTSDPHSLQSTYQAPPLAYAPNDSVAPPQLEQQPTSYPPQGPSYLSDSFANNQPAPPPAHAPAPSQNGYAQQSDFPAPSSPRQQQAYTYTQQHPVHTYYDQQQGQQGVSVAAAPFGGYATGSAPAGYAPPPEKPLEAPLIEF